jgi:hypothetical protein
MFSLGGVGARGAKAASCGVKVACADFGVADGALVGGACNLKEEDSFFANDDWGSTICCPGVNGDSSMSERLR